LTAKSKRLYAKSFQCVPARENPLRSISDQKELKHIYHSIACIGALVAHRDDDHWAVDALGAPHVGERTEKELIQAFVDKIAQLNPQFVTFNGNSFDLPVLRYRAMTHRVAAPGLSARPYFNRYIWLRYELFRGRLNESGYEASERYLGEFIKARGKTKPHLVEIVN
jgi:predicted PolB exonuclease-like 3'-5' exonuclease